MSAVINKPRLNTDLKTYIVQSGIFLRDMRNRKTYHVGKLEYIMLSSFDGKHTVDELKTINSKYVSKKQLEEFVFYANENGLLESDQKHKKSIDVLRLRKSLCCPMQFLHAGQIMELLKVFLIAGSIISLAIITWFITTQSTLIFEVIFTNDYLQVINILYYFISIFIIGFFHELGHAVMIVASGGNAFELGVMLNYFHPAFYVDITGVDQIQSRKGRICVWLAGIMSEIILALPTMILTFYDKSPLYLNEFLIIFNILNVSMVIFNLLFVIKLDGYHILSELLEIKGLRERAIQSVMAGNAMQEAGNVKIAERLIFNVVGLISIIYLPLFLMKLALTGIQHFLPKVMPVANIVMLVWVILLCGIFIIRVILAHVKERQR